MTLTLFNLGLSFPRLEVVEDQRYCLMRCDLFQENTLSSGPIEGMCVKQ